ncbi:hypothetical protein O181_096520 [Austropuccinia psidii MF-1]|uniref:No apical meristem-associated C-terminal domain-containing protein n=1 Tax=Austropuccinia psidii MF-1 TaxID=1389203 RepID=A0A9Q3PD26_9BASI|nr:hypothetical protein [Austropuccinia psidii MF-1]
MVIEVNKKSQNCLNLSSSSIQDQWRTYKKKYMAAKKFENLTEAGLTEEVESKGIKSMSEKLESMCPCYAEMDVLFGHKPNFTPISSYDSQGKYSLNGDDDDDVLLDKQSKSITQSTKKRNQALTPNFNDKSGSRKGPMDMFSLTYANLLESWKKACETSENSRLEWDRERQNEEKASKMEKQHFEEVKLQKQIDFEEKKHTKKQEFEKEKWNWEFQIKEKKFQMHLTIEALSSSRPISELERILTLIHKK